MNLGSFEKILDTWNSLVDFTRNPEVVDRAPPEGTTSADHLAQALVRFGLAGVDRPGADVIAHFPHCYTKPEDGSLKVVTFLRFWRGMEDYLRERGKFRPAAGIAGVIIEGFQALRDDLLRIEQEEIDDIQSNGVHLLCTIEYSTFRSMLFQHEKRVRRTDIAQYWRQIRDPFKQFSDGDAMSYADVSAYFVTWLDGGVKNSRAAVDVDDDSCGIEEDPEEEAPDPGPFDDGSSMHPIFGDSSDDERSWSPGVRPAIRGAPREQSGLVDVARVPACDFAQSARPRFLALQLQRLCVRRLAQSWRTLYVNATAAAPAVHEHDPDIIHELVKSQAHASVLLEQQVQAMERRFRLTALVDRLHRIVWPILGNHLRHFVDAAGRRRTSHFEPPQRSAGGRPRVDSSLRIDPRSTGPERPLSRGTPVSGGGYRERRAREAQSQQLSFGSDRSERAVSSHRHAAESPGAAGSRERPEADQHERTWSGAKGLDDTASPPPLPLHSERSARFDGGDGSVTSLHRGWDRSPRAPGGSQETTLAPDSCDSVNQVRRSSMNVGTPVPTSSAVARNILMRRVRRANPAKGQVEDEV